MSKIIISGDAVYMRVHAIIKAKKPVCDMGGCDHHSKHEYCAVDAAWDQAVERAEDELRQEAEAAEEA